MFFFLFNLNFTSTRKDSLRHFLCVSSTLFREQFYNRLQTFQNNSLLLWIGLRVHSSPRILHFHPGLSFLQ